jgi:hypothetical protein
MPIEWEVFNKTTGARVGDTYRTPGEARNAAEHRNGARTEREQLQGVDYKSRRTTPASPSLWKRKSSGSLGGPRRSKLF